MSARILLPTFGSFGDIHPFLAIALELQTRGHEPVIATSEIYRAKIEEAGIAFHAIAPDLPPRHEWNNYIPRLMDGIRGPQRLFTEVLSPSVRQAYSDLLPEVQRSDLVVAHGIVHAAPLAAEIAEKKWLSVVLAPLALWSVHDAPLAPGMPELPWFSENRALQLLLKSVVKRVSRSWVIPVDELRKELGLPRGQHPLFEGAHSPHGTLALFSKELATPKPDWPNTVQTGYCFYDQKGNFFGEAEYASSMTSELQQFLSSGEPPLVWTLGSAAVFDARNFFHAAVEASRRLNRRAVLLIGEQTNRPQNLLQKDHQIAAFEYAPYDELFPRAAAVVHQGGAGTTGQVLRAGVPSLVMPYSHDQPDHARRLQRRGVARILSRRQCNAGTLVRELELLSNNTVYGNSARSIGLAVQAEDGTSAASDAIENSLRGVQ